MSTRLEQFKNTETQIHKQINEKKFYEALRLVVTLSNRYISMKLPQEAFRFTFECASAILKQREWKVGYEVSHQYLTMITKNNLHITPEMAAHLKALFALYQTPEASSSSTPGADVVYDITNHTKFITEALLIVRKQIKALTEKKEEEDGMHADIDTKLKELTEAEALLHYTYALFLFNYGEFSAFNIHFILAVQKSFNDPDVPVQHALLYLERISPLGLAEQGLAILRVVLMYLTSILDLERAEKFAPVNAFIDTVATKLFEVLNTQPMKLYIDCCLNLVTMAKVGSIDVFDTMVEVYKPIIESCPDPQVDELMQRVGEKYCGVAPTGGDSAQSLLGSLGALFGGH